MLHLGWTEIQNQTNPSKKWMQEWTINCPLFVKKYLRNYHQTGRRVISESIKVHETIFRPRWSKYNVGLHSKDAIYHKNCYSNVVNKRNLSKAIERQKRAKKNYDATYISPKRETNITFTTYNYIRRKCVNFKFCKTFSIYS